MPYSLTITDTHPLSAIYIHDPAIKYISFHQHHESIVTSLPTNVNTIVRLDSNTSIQLTKSHDEIKYLDYDDESADARGIRVDFTKMPKLIKFTMMNSHAPRVPTFTHKIDLRFDNCNMNRIYIRAKSEFRHVEVARSCTQTEANLDLFGDMEMERLLLRCTLFNDILPKLPASLKHLYLDNYVAGFTNLPQESITFTTTKKDYPRYYISRDDINMQDLLVGPNVFDDIDQYYRKYPDTPRININISCGLFGKSVRIIRFYDKIEDEWANDVFNMNVIEYNCKSSRFNSRQNQSKQIDNIRTVLGVGDIQKIIRGFLKGSGEYRT